MLNCSLSELRKLSDIIECEKNISFKYEEYSKSVNDPQLKEKFQKCAATHKNQFTILTELIKS